MTQGRRVRLVVRRVEPWTVLKFSVLLYLTMYLVILVAGIVLWAVASATGLRGNVEKFIGELIASDNFALLGGAVAKASVLGGAVLVVMGSGANVLLTVLYNLIADVVGGVVVLFEERPARRRRGRVQLGEAGEPLAPLTPSRRARGSGGPARSRRQQSADLEPPAPGEPDAEAETEPARSRGVTRSAD